MSRAKYPVTLLADFYKLSHREQYPKNTEVVYSTFTPRSNKHYPEVNEVVVFGIQSFIKKYLMEYFSEHFFNRPKEDIVSEYKRFVKFTLGLEDADTTHLEDLHDLGYLPLEIKALKEGTRVPMKVPVLTIMNTHPKFFWLTNFLETLISNEIWQPMTSASISYQYRNILDKYAMETTGNTEGVGFQCHDFSMRGMSSLETAMSSGAGHLLSFQGTDTIPAILYLEDYYRADIETELVGASIPATEHSVMSANTNGDNRDETEAFRRLLTEVYPNGLFSVVSDTYDFWKVVGEILPKLKKEIMNRDGKMVIRPDSGDPVEILCGERIEEFDNLKDAEGTLRWRAEQAGENASGDGFCGDEEHEYLCKVGGRYYKMVIEVEYQRHDKRFYYVEDTRVLSTEKVTPTLEQLGLIEALWNIFKGTVTEQGYKVLDSHIGAIYGDSITLDIATQVCERLKEKGFASTNVVFGVGSYTFQHNTRDSFGFAMKATYAVIDGKEVKLFKDPKTDDGTKRSLKGMVAVLKSHVGFITVRDGLNRNRRDEHFSAFDQLETVFNDGVLLRDQSLAEIREILHN